jgi:hypothetical protein
MQLDLTDEESEALLRELNAIIENDRLPLSPLQQIRAKLLGAPPPPPRARPPIPEERDPTRAPRQGKRRRG